MFDFIGKGYIFATLFRFNLIKMKNTFILSLVLLALLVSCDEKENDKKQYAFDRKAMLESYADKIIIPAYERLKEQTGRLQQVLNTLADTPTLTNLEMAQNAWRNAYLAWQSVNSFNFGPAESPFGTLLDEVGTFPCSVTKIESYISRGDNSFQNFDRDARGFIAIEYLIFSLEDKQETILSLLQNSTNRRNYLKALGLRLHNEVSKVATGWTTFKSDFIKNSGTDAGSSTAELYNEFVKSYESIKNFKVGLPAGKRPGQTKTEPHLVEAYYSGTSVDMLKAHFQSIEKIWRGDTIGFRDYLMTVEGGKNLVTATEAQLLATQKAIAQLPTERLSETIEKNFSVVNKLHDELQKLTRFFKSDMSSLLGISITYDSGDGD